jgi:hypothetical protein
MRYAVLTAPLLAVAFFVLASTAAIALNDIRTQQVHFRADANSAVVEGKITGYETIDYVLEASKGQHMNVGMATKNGANYFNILAPGENEVAIFNGSVNGNQYEGVLPKNGAYKIRVYMMRSAARRNEVAKYRLEMAISGAADKPSTADAAKPGGMPSKDEQACLEAVSIKTNNGDVTVLSTETSEANNVVIVGVGPRRAPWRCLVSEGVVAEVSSQTDEGRL